MQKTLALSSAALARAALRPTSSLAGRSQRIARPLSGSASRCYSAQPSEESRSASERSSPSSPPPSLSEHAPAPSLVPEQAPGSSPSSSSSSSSSSSPPPPGKGNSSRSRNLSTLYIALSTLAVGTATHFLLPSQSASSPSSATARADLNLDSRRYNTLPLSSTTPYPSLSASSDHRHLSILLPSSPAAASAPSEPSSELDRLRIRSIYIKEPALQIERAYTPLYDTLPHSHALSAIGAGTDHIDLIIKRYRDGELGRYAHRLSPGERVEVRGPVETWSYTSHHRIRVSDGTTQPPSGAPDEIVLLVGGTGITPAYQLVTSLLGRPHSSPPPSTAAPPRGKTRLTLLYGTPSLESALLLPQLHALAASHPDRLQVGVFSESLRTSPAASAAAAKPSTSEGSGVPPSELYQPTFDRHVQTQLEVVPHGAAPSSWWKRPLQAVGLVSSSAPSPPSGPTSMQRWQHGPSPSHLLRPAAAAPGSDTPTPPFPLPLYTSRITAQHIQALAPQNGGRDSVVVLVCGPDGMVQQLAGPRARDGVSQGPLAGVLQRLGYRSEQVFKL